MPLERSSTKSSRLALSNVDLAPDEVVERGGALVGRPEPQRPSRARARGRGRGRSRRSRAGRRAPWRGPGPARPCSRSSRRGRRRSARPRRRVYSSSALGLVDGLAVPVEAEPAQHLEDVVDQLGPVALGVGVLDAQEELAPVPAGEQPVEQRRAGRRRRGGSRWATARSGAGRSPGEGSGAVRADGPRARRRARRVLTLKDSSEVRAPELSDRLVVGLGDAVALVLRDAPPTSCRSGWSTSRA